MKKNKPLLPISISDFLEQSPISNNIKIGARQKNRRILMDRYNSLMKKSNLVCNYFKQKIEQHEKLKQSLHVSITLKKALFDTQTDPISHSITREITYPCFMSDKASTIALQQFSIKLLGLVQHSIKYVCDDFEDITLVKEMMRLQNQCEIDIEFFKSASLVLTTFIEDELPYLDGVIDYNNLTTDILSRFQEVINRQMSLAKLSINRFNWLVVNDKSPLKQLKELNNSITTLGSRFKGKDFSAFKESYVKRAARYLYKGNDDNSLSGVIEETSPHASNFANFCTFFIGSPHRFISPVFNDDDENNKIKALTLLRQTAVETIDKNDACVIL